METVRIKSRVGPHHILRRYWNEDGEYVKQPYDWTFDNSFICMLPKDYWETLENEFLDRRANLRYKEAFIEL